MGGRLRMMAVICGMPVALAAAVSPVPAWGVTAAGAARMVNPPIDPMEHLATRSPGCEQVIFIGARGSGESNGLGPEVAKIESVIAGQLVAHKIMVKTIFDPYRADSVDDLKPTAAEIALFALSPALGAAYYLEQNVLRYLASLREGITEAVVLAQDANQICPHSLLVMAGYSQGAMVVHQAELRLAASHDTTVLNQIAATVLVGDGDRIRNSAAHRFGTAKATAKGIRTWFGQNNGMDVLQPGTTADVCNAGDIVCDFGRARVQSLQAANDAVKVHEAYTGDSALAKAATWAAGLAIKRIPKPTLTLTPSQGLPGTTVMVTGTAFRPAETVTVANLTSPGPAVCTAKATASGSFSCHGHVNATSYTPQRIIATGDTSQITAAATFRVVSPWKPVVAPLPADANGFDVGLDSVTCLSASSCLAGGLYSINSHFANDDWPLLEALSGSKWTPTRAPLPADANTANPQAVIGSVACATTSSCVGSGTYVNSSTEFLGFLEALSGGAWTVTKAPLPAGTLVGNQVVSPVSAACSPGSGCVVAGWIGDSSITQCGTDGTGSLAATPLLWVQSGKSWSVIAAPLPASASSAFPSACLASVTCPSASTCVAVGTFMDTSNHLQPLIETGSGTTWTATQAPVPGDAVANPITTFSSVTCPSATACVAVGDYTGASGNAQPLIETGFGATWTATNAPLPADASSGGFASLGAVACSSASSCAAVGGYMAGASRRGLIEVGSGTTWTVIKEPIPGGGQAEGADVACPSASSCVAAGTYLDAALNFQGYTETGAGGTWKAVLAPLPADANSDPGVTLPSLSCPSVTFCVAVGIYGDSSQKSHGLLLTGPG